MRWGLVFYSRSLLIEFEKCAFNSQPDTRWTGFVVVLILHYFPPSPEIERLRFFFCFDLIYNQGVNREWNRWLRANKCEPKSLMLLPLQSFLMTAITITRRTTTTILSRLKKSVESHGMMTHPLSSLSQSLDFNNPLISTTVVYIYRKE